MSTGWRSDVQFAHIETRDVAAPGEAVLRGPIRKVAHDLGVARILLSIAATADAAMAAAVATRGDNDAR